MSDLDYDLSSDIDVGVKKIEQKQAIVKYNEKVEQLSDKIVYHMQNKTAVSEQVVEILLPFLEVAVEMQAIIEVITSVNDVVDLIGEAIGLIDGTMNQNQTFLQDNTVKLGWFAKIKRKLQQRAIINNNKRRAEAIADSLVYQYEIAMGLAGSFKAIPDKLHGAMDKIKKNNRGKGGKGKGSDEKYQMSDGLKKLLTDKGADLGSLGYLGTSQSSAPSSSGGISEGL